MQGKIRTKTIRCKASTSSDKQGLISCEKWPNSELLTLGINNPTCLQVPRITVYYQGFEVDKVSPNVWTSLSEKTLTRRVPTRAEEDDNGMTLYLGLLPGAAPLTPRLLWPGHILRLMTAFT